MSERLKTWRLMGRPVTADDAPLLESVWRDREAARWVSPDGAPWSVSKVAAGTRRMAAHWEAHGFGPYLWFKNDRFICYAGLKFAQIDRESVVEALWGAPPEHWGRGYGSEAAAGVMETAPGLGFRRIVAIALEENTRSQGVMNRLNFRHERNIRHYDKPHVLYVRTLP